MALRIIRKHGDEILTKRSKEVTKIDQRTLKLLDDMRDTLANANGAGLAAPQIGVLRRVVLVDVGEGVMELINPEILSTEGEVVAVEGCLSLPGRYGEVPRPAKAVVKALDREGKEIEIIGEGLLARALCHEVDHLEGKMFMEKVIKYVD